MSDNAECQLSPEELAKAKSALKTAIFHMTGAVFFQDMSQCPRWHLEICTATSHVTKSLNAGEQLPLSPGRFDAVLSDIIEELRWRIAKQKIA